MASNRGLLANMKAIGRRNPKTIGIIGAGRFGTAAAEELLSSGHEVLVVDKDPEFLEPLAHRCDTAIGNAESKEFLAEAGIKDVDAVIIAIGDDESASNHAVINCKDFGLYVMVKAKGATHGTILERLGADYVVYPERDSGTRLARLLTRSSILDMVELYEQVFMMEIDVGGELTGKTLDKLNLTNRFGVQVVMVIRGEETIFPVSATVTLRDEDRAVVLGSVESLQKVARIAEAERVR